MKLLFLFSTVLFCLSASAQFTVSSNTAGKLEFVELEYGIGQKVDGTTVQDKASPTGTRGWLEDYMIIKQTDSVPMVRKANFGTVYIIKAKDTVDIAVFSKGATSGSNDTLICANTSVQLTASGGITYKWSPAATLNNSTIPGPVATPSQLTDYVVEMTDLNNCVFRDTIRVALKPYPDFGISRDTSICIGSKVKLNARGGDLYQWTPSVSLDNPQAASPLLTPLISSTYNVYVKDNLCSYDTTMTVQVSLAASPNIFAAKLADIDCQNPTTQLMASGATSYSWAPASGVDDARKQNPVVAIDSTTTFVLTGTDQNGCSGKDTVTVSVTKAGLPLFVLPNAFTPNNDGKNDCFGIKRWGNVDIIQLAVYNRWGQIVFETKNPRQCWDGSYKGQRQPAGGYIYVIKARSFCGDIVRKGNLMLLN
ncbi:MAG: gliding motility-associated C-terminal domain-containing protein [Chitinophagaceae bacterium]|nr:MAG: gliding motility-associated C-terminal domain-containing protein [Chitinophagaceae bacterium]